MANQTKAQTEKASSLLSKLFVIDTCWERQKLVFFSNVSLSTSVTLCDKPHAQEYLEHKADSMLSLFAFVLFWQFFYVSRFHLFALIFTFYFCLLALLREEKKVKLGG